MRPAGRSNNRASRYLTRNSYKTCRRLGAGSNLAIKVLCTASIEEGVPALPERVRARLINAEYWLLRSTEHTANAREAAKGKQNWIHNVIQRPDRPCSSRGSRFKHWGEFTITLDSTMLQADGGTRTASITGACVALADALPEAVENGKLKTNQ